MKKIWQALIRSKMLRNKADRNKAGSKKSGVSSQKPGLSSGVRGPKSGLNPSPVTRRLSLIIGGTRSGKSAFALKEASAVSGKKAYIATAEPLDAEMEERIERHREERGKVWVTYEEPLKTADLLKDISKEYSVILVDCLTLWLSNVMGAGLDVEAEIKRLISSLVIHRPSRVFVVSNEVGMGLVPDNELSRRFRDAAGFLNQRVAGIADEVYLVTAGIPLKIK